MGEKSPFLLEDNRFIAQCQMIYGCFVLYSHWYQYHFVRHFYYPINKKSEEITCTEIASTKVKSSTCRRNMSVSRSTLNQTSWENLRPPVLPTALRQQQKSKNSYQDILNPTARNSDPPPPLRGRFFHAFSKESFNISRYSFVWSLAAGTRYGLAFIGKPICQLPNSSM